MQRCTQLEAQCFNFQKCAAEQALKAAFTAALVQQLVCATSIHTSSKSALLVPKRVSLDDSNSKDSISWAPKFEMRKVPKIGSTSRDDQRTEKCILTWQLPRGICYLPTVDFHSAVVGGTLEKRWVWYSANIKKCCVHLQVRCCTSFQGRFHDK